MLYLAQNSTDVMGQNTTFLLKYKLYVSAKNAESPKIAFNFDHEFESIKCCIWLKIARM